MENQHRIRVNGLIVAHIDVRHALANGIPCGEWRIAINDPLLGWITLDDNDNLWDHDLPKFVLEVRENPERNWRRVRIPELLELLAATGVIC